MPMLRRQRQLFDDFTVHRTILEIFLFDDQVNNIIIFKIEIFFFVLAENERHSAISTNQNSTHTQAFLI